MAARKTPKSKGATLDSLIGKKVMIQQNYRDIPTGPFTVLGIDDGYLCIEVENNGVVWANSRTIEVIREYAEQPDDQQ